MATFLTRMRPPLLRNAVRVPKPQSINLVFEDLTGHQLALAKDNQPYSKRSVSFESINGTCRDFEMVPFWDKLAKLFGGKSKQANKSANKKESCKKKKCESKKDACMKKASSCEKQKVKKDPTADCKSKSESQKKEAPKNKCGSGDENKKKEVQCKKKEENPCKKKEDPCKKKEDDPCKKKEEDPCKKKEDPCKKKEEDPCKKKEDPCKKKEEDPCKKKEDPCKKKEDPCKKKEEDPCKKKEDPCKKKEEDPCKKKEDPCKKKEEDPCKKKEDPCKKKEDPCKKKEEDPCKKKEDPCKKKEDPCKKKEEDPCKKKEDPCKKKEEPCKKKEEDACKKKEDPCKKKEEDPCKKKAEDPCKKKEDPCKKKEEDPCKKKEDPCKKKDDPCKKFISLNPILEASFLSFSQKGSSKKQDNECSKPCRDPCVPGACDQLPGYDEPCSNSVSWKVKVHPCRRQPELPPSRPTVASACIVDEKPEPMKLEPDDGCLTQSPCGKQVCPNKCEPKSKTKFSKSFPQDAIKVLTFDKGDFFKISKLDFATTTNTFNQQRRTIPKMTPPPKNTVTKTDKESPRKVAGFFNKIRDIMYGPPKSEGERAQPVARKPGIKPAQRQFKSIEPLGHHEWSSITTLAENDPLILFQDKRDDFEKCEDAKPPCPEDLPRLPCPGKMEECKQVSDDLWSDIDAHWGYEKFPWKSDLIKDNRLDEVSLTPDDPFANDKL